MKQITIGEKYYNSFLLRSSAGIKEFINEYNKELLEILESKGIEALRAKLNNDIKVSEGKE
jgi:hypothetical protein